MCLPSRCLVMNVYSDYANPAFERHDTIFILNGATKLVGYEQVYNYMI
jgi:hypothetical protein